MKPLLYLQASAMAHWTLVMLSFQKGRNWMINNMHPLTFLDGFQIPYTILSNITLSLEIIKLKGCFKSSKDFSQKVDGQTDLFE